LVYGIETTSRITKKIANLFDYRLQNYSLQTIAY